ncbi:MAG TPA: lysophospholipid acyltransferase family protein [Acidimicrobiales bacterium]|jgi:1-acyl-sn-glycerol-3-phosphate acyltransferase|nr:lysophospholipid acyltransferase family protein [Acidimicrobiales bacterium]
MTRLDRVIYAVTWHAIIAVGKVWFRVRVEGREHLPRAGACVVSPVHRSNLDTPILAFVTRRRLRFMGKDSLWKHRISAWYLSALGGFPVERGTADRGALRVCQAILERGEPLVMFAEGTRRSGAIVEDLYDGPAFLAARTGVPIVPIGIGGSERVMPKGAKFPRPKRVAIVIGAPIVPPAHDGRVPRRVVRELTDQLEADLQRLFDQATERAG